MTEACCQLWISILRLPSKGLAAHCDPLDSKTSSPESKTTLDLHRNLQPHPVVPTPHGQGALHSQHHYKLGVPQILENSATSPPASAGVGAADIHVQHLSVVTHCGLDWATQAPEGVPNILRIAWKVFSKLRDVKYLYLCLSLDLCRYLCLYGYLYVCIYMQLPMLRALTELLPCLKVPFKVPGIFMAGFPSTARSTSSYVRT